MAYLPKMHLVHPLLRLNPVTTMIEVMECKEDASISLHMEVDILRSDSPEIVIIPTIWNI